MCGLLHTLLTARYKLRSRMLANAINRWRRRLDVAALVFGAPTILGTAAVTIAALRLCDRGPLLFRHRRVGLGGQPFLVLKFRTMTETTAGPSVTAWGDTRVTPIGAWLRRLKLDELPQLINVARGEMSLIGPRPEAVHYVSPE